MDERYYNLFIIKETSVASTYVKITECDDEGAELGAAGTNAMHERPSVSYTPTGPTTGFMHFIYRDGSKSVPFTVDNVINLQGSPHGASRTHDLFDAIATILETPAGE